MKSLSTPKRLISSLLKHLVLTLFAATCLYPFIWMIGTSLKTSQEALLDPASIWPSGALNWEIYPEVWEQLNFFLYFTNSVVYSVSVVVGVVLLYSMVGFALACINFKGKKVIFICFIALILVPGLTVQIPLFLNMVALGMADTFFGLILPIINGAGPLAVLLFRNQFRAIPIELYESAKIDGSSVFGIYARIYLPLSLPTIGTIGVINFIGMWNAIVWPLIVLRSERMFTLQIAIMYLDEAVFTQWNVLMAGAVISVIPLILVFVFFQKYYVQGLTMGSVKA
jgi:ABC-type glycerol-3-phosphate transport system permease component